jgi:NADH dehydrogenase [ubiquinone] 1 alpha subcomplex assembly factor 7
LGVKVSHEPNLTALRIAKQIETAGPISVAEYMRNSNEDYYNYCNPFGVKGDFVTAPEISQMFGELVGIWLADIWLRSGRPSRCHFVELGPGRGTLAADCLRTMEKFGLFPTIHLVEQSEALRDKQITLLPEAHFHDSIDDLPDDGLLLIVANEFFDALPVRQMVSTHAGWRERVVARGKTDCFIAMPGAMVVDHMVPLEFRDAPNGSIFETSPAASNFMYEIAARLGRQGGILLIIDYGYAEPGMGSTLQAVQDHMFVEPFENPGKVDLSAHVNFLELSNLAKMRNLQVFGPSDQGGWLEALGINQRTARLVETNPDHAEELIAARNRLVESDQMGNLFKVMAVASIDAPIPEGFDAKIV